MVRPSDTKKSAVRAIVKKLPNLGDSVYHALPWSSPDGIKRANCYGYALNKLGEHGSTKLQPGDIAARRRGYPDRHAEALASGELDETTCPDIRARIEDDLQDDVYVEKPRTPCQDGFYKIMLSIARGRDQQHTDYHWHRQFQHLMLDLPGGIDVRKVAALYRVPVANVVKVGPRRIFVRDANVWASKHGFATGALLTDTCGKPIFDPRVACRKVNDLEYKTMCNSFCVRSQRKR